MPARVGTAEWKGDLQEGSGSVALGSGSFSGPYSYDTRFRDETGTPGTNPEELIAGAHAACYAMALSNALSSKGFIPTSVRTSARVRLEQVEAGFAITRIDLAVEADVPGLGEAEFLEEAQSAKQNCPVSKALSAVEITLDAKLA